MLKKTIKYTDFNGNEVTEDFYFNLTKAEIAEMELASSTLDAEGNMSGGMEAALQAIVNSGSGKKIMDAFKEILAKSYGVKSEDGKRFIKSPQLFEEFTQTEAYSDFFIGLVTDADAAADFVKAIVPPMVVESDKPEPPKKN
jgi:hypothetical protein